MSRPVLKNRIEKLLKSGFVQEGRLGEVAITLRGQLELARWRYRRLPKSRFVFLGPMPRGSFLDRIPIPRSNLLDRLFKSG